MRLLAYIQSQEDIKVWREREVAEYFNVEVKMYAVMNSGQTVANFLVCNFSIFEKFDINCAASE